MMKNNNETWFFIDFENLPSLTESSAQTDSFRIFVFVGSQQNKIPFDIVKKAHKFGNRLEWIKIEGSGKNNLDFHLSFHLGKFDETADKDVTFIVFSKDTGFDRLISFINSNGRTCRRITEFESYIKEKISEPQETDIPRIIQNIAKIKTNKRPRKIRTLKNHLQSIIKKAGSNLNADDIFDKLIQEKVVSVDENKVIYHIHDS